MDGQTDGLYTQCGLQDGRIAVTTIIVTWKRRTKNPAVARVRPTVLVVTDFKGHPRLMIFMSSERAYATSYLWLIATFALSFTV